MPDSPVLEVSKVQENLAAEARKLESILEKNPPLLAFIDSNDVGLIMDVAERLGQSRQLLAGVGAFFRS
jgi:hypothetical protein